MGFTRFSRPAGSEEPFKHKVENRVSLTPVFIGNRNPGVRLHHAKVADVWLPEQELYRPRRRRD